MRTTIFYLLALCFETLSRINHLYYNSNIIKQPNSIDQLNDWQFLHHHRCHYCVNVSCSQDNFYSLSRDKFIEKGKQNNIVYKIPCADCNAVYIGESKRSFDQRSKEHVRAVKNGDVDKNEIADHSWKLDHKFDWENKIIIDREQNWRVRKIKETIHSISDKNHINSISYSLPEIWLPALKKPHGN